MAIFQLLLLCAVGATAFVVRLAQHRRFYRDLVRYMLAFEVRSY
jgi:hypothetical protein